MDDANPRIAILGAGPVGLEAALYARYLGYPTQVFERQRAAAWSVLMGEQSVGVFATVASRLGVSALRAQDPHWQAPAASIPMTATQWHAKYLAPLSESDLIAEVLHLNHEIVGIARRDAEDDESFEIQFRIADGTASVHMSDIVVDATGIASPNWRGDGTLDEQLGFANPEADFYVLGAKGGAKSFVAGLVQIRDLFAILGERDDLDVYATMPELE